MFGDGGGIGFASVVGASEILLDIELLDWLSVVSTIRVATAVGRESNNDS